MGLGTGWRSLWEAPCPLPPGWGHPARSSPPVSTRRQKRGAGESRGAGVAGPSCHPRGTGTALSPRGRGRQGPLEVMCAAGIFGAWFCLVPKPTTRACQARFSSGVWFGPCFGVTHPGAAVTVSRRRGWRREGDLLCIAAVPPGRGSLQRPAPPLHAWESASGRVERGTGTERVCNPATEEEMMSRACVVISDALLMML